MKHRYQPSSELQRAAEEAVRNEQRLIAWRKRRAIHGNSNVIKFPRHKRQYIGSDLPTGPEVA